MATYVAGQIPFYSAISSLDPANDLLEIVDISANATYNITPNALMGITSGSAVSTTMAQTVQNKTFDATNTFTPTDSLWTMQDNGDSTKQMNFQLSGITTGNTRTLTIPDASGTIVLTAATQTLTAKTLTAPVISGGSIDNATVTVDAVAGHTTSNTGTIYGIAVTSGQITNAAIANGTIGSAQIATNGVGGSNLATSAITLGYAQITSNPSSVSNSFAAVTGLSVTVTVPSGGRKVKITGYWVISSTSTGDAAISIVEGSNQLSQGSAYVGNTSNAFGVIAIAVITPTAGSHTYFLEAFMSAGTGTINAGAGTTPGNAPPAFILVEAI